MQSSLETAPELFFHLSPMNLQKNDEKGNRRNCYVGGGTIVSCGDINDPSDRQTPATLFPVTNTKNMRNLVTVPSVLCFLFQILLNEKSMFHRHSLKASF